MFHNKAKYAIEIHANIKYTYKKKTYLGKEYVIYPLLVFDDFL